MLQVSEVSKRFGAKVALYSVSFSIGPGEVVGLLGPNGAGKTTTLRIITGLVRPDQGSVELNGTRISPTAIQQTIGYLPDEPFLYPKLTGREFLGFIASLRELPPPVVHERVGRLATAFELTGVLDDLIETYSLGTRRKVALVGSLLQDPTLLVLDEPLNGLDPISVKRVKDLLADHVRRGRSVLLSTHLLDIAQSLCDSVLIIDKGRIVMEKQPLSGIEGSLEDRFISVVSPQEGGS